MLIFILPLFIAIANIFNFFIGYSKLNNWISLMYIILVFES